MIGRNVEARIIKLEAKNRRSDEMLVLWRLPSESVKEVVGRARFNAGDRVLCVEWLNGQEPPQPTWYSDRATSSLRHDLRTVYEAIGAACEKRRADLEARRPPEAETPADRERQKELLTSMSDADLLYALFGVPA
jgi:hypothetical protein